MACCNQFALVALVALVVAVAPAASHPALTGKPLGTNFPEASSFVFGTELDV